VLTRRPLLRLSLPWRPGWSHQVPVPPLILPCTPTFSDLPPGGQGADGCQSL